MQKFQQFHPVLKKRIEKTEEKIEKKLTQYFFKYIQSVQSHGYEMFITLIRDYGDFTKETTVCDPFTKNYRSRIWIAIGSPENSDVQKHKYIPVYECKKQFFSLNGILYEENIENFEKECTMFINQFLHEHVS
ncbi:MAG TPA: hypothetical protein VLA13_01960 [Massilibacterium sp.]|nr:hypothetical protein [Massilibacterium sp.]